MFVLDDGSIAIEPPRHLSLLFLFLIVFLLFRLRTLGLSARDLRFLLHWLVRLVSRFRLRLLRVAMLWVAIFVI